MLSKEKLVDILLKKEDDYDEFIKKSRIVKKILDFYYNWDGDPATLDFREISFKELLTASQIIWEHDETNYDEVLIKDDPISHMLFASYALVPFFKSIPSSGVVDYL